MTNQSGEEPVKRVFTDPQWGKAGASTPKFSVSAQSAEGSAKANAVSIVDINMPFWSMVQFMIKWVVASIPAFIILFLLGTLLGAMIGAVFSK